MSNLKLLDCTLRDGGYVNDWEFGAGSIRSIFCRLDCAGVDRIEVGFIDDRRTYDPNRSIYPDTQSIEPIFKGMDRPHAMVTAMIDLGTCDIKHVAPASESHIDAIRVIFKKHRQDEALDFLAQLKAKGYGIFVNPVSVTSYNDEEMVSLIEKINQLAPNAVTIVDTYGLTHGQESLHYCELMNEHLNPGITLGYHGHNNFQLAYANSIAVMTSIKGRDLSIDGTLFGMGKSAGNACTELLAMYMNQYCGKSYDINQIQEAIDVDIQKEYDKCSWGYRSHFYIAALHNCHPSYVKYLQDKRSLSIKSINEILEKIPEPDKLMYSETRIAELYADYQNNVIDDTQAVQDLKMAIAGRPLLLLGPGKTLESEGDAIRSFISEHRPIIISVNFLSESFPIDVVFMGNAKRYSQFFDALYGQSAKVKTICTSNITGTESAIDYTVNYSSLLSDVECIRDNPLIMLLYLLRKMGTESVTLAGFDGYVEGDEQNYYGAYIQMLYCQADVLARNNAIRERITALQGDMRISNLTTSKYFA